MTLIFNNNEYADILRTLNNNKNSIDNICGICKDTLLLDTLTLPCNHRFHSNCLKESFFSYQKKKCPYCNIDIPWNLYKKKCMIKKKNGEQCNKVCYNDESICSLHVKVKLRILEKDEDKIKKDELKKKKKLKNSLKKKIDSRLKQINKMREKMSILENEMQLFENEYNNIAIV